MRCVLVLSILSCACAFTSVQFQRRSVLLPVRMSDRIEDITPSSSPDLAKFETVLAAATAALLIATSPVDALEGPASILAGRTASMLHPLTNLALFGTSIYAAYLGLQWRRLREIGEEIKVLNKELPKLSSGPPKIPFSDAKAFITRELISLAADDASASVLQKDLALLDGAGDLDLKILDLSATRKQLLSMDLRDKHYLTGSVLLGVGVSVALLGCVNTYLRAGKLFPGPHLFAGAAIVGIWAISAALVPSMQKGNDGARSAHIALNAVNVGLFGWQVATGLDIMQKVFEHTSWP